MKSHPPFPTLTSIIIPWQGTDRRLLAGAIESSLAQRQAAIEVIVVASPQGMRSLDGLACADPHAQVRYVTCPYPTLATLRNVGIEECRGQYVLFLNPTEYLLPNAVQLAASYLDAMSPCDLVMGIAQTKETRDSDAIGLSLQSAIDLTEQAADVSLYQSLLQGKQAAPLARAVFRKTVFERVGGFDAALAPADDYDLLLRVASQSLCSWLNQVFIEYQHPSPGFFPLVTRASQSLQMHLQALWQQRTVAQMQSHVYASYRQGLRYWCQMYGAGLMGEFRYLLQQRQMKAAAKAFYLLLRYYPQGLRYLWILPHPQMPFSSSVLSSMQTRY